ncbi:hypothetical protein, partial [Aeromonas bestiarum]
RKAVVVGANVTEQCNGGTHNSNLLCALLSLRLEPQNRGMAKHMHIPTHGDRSITFMPIT